MSARSNAGRIGVWGRSGSGKSSFVKKLIKGRKRLIIFDPLDEYGPELRIRSIAHRKANDLDEVRKAMASDWRSFRVAYVPPAGQEAAALSALCKLLMAAQQPFKDGRSAQTITLVVEEMNLSFPVGGGVQKCPGFAEICSRGRHFGIEVFGVSQRIAEVNTRFRGNCTETVVLKQRGPRDVDAAAAELGIPKAKVTALKPLEYLHEKGGEITAGKITFGKAANSNRPPAANSNRAPAKAKRRA